MEHGPVTGSLTFVANMGITYWFPNKYFHTIMHGIPELIPLNLGRTKKFAAAKGGQALIGVSLIVVIEQILQKAEELSRKAPSMFGNKPSKDLEQKTFENIEDKVKKATAGFIIDGTLLKDNFGNNDDLLIYLLNATQEGGLFSGDENTSSLLLQKIKLQDPFLDLKSFETRGQSLGLRLEPLLSADEILKFNLRLNLLKKP